MQTFTECSVVRLGWSREDTRKMHSYGQIQLG